MADLSATERDFEKFKEHMPWLAEDDGLIVLKGHLLIEELMREFCAEKVRSANHIEHAGLTFAQIVCLTRALATNDGPSWLWGAAAKLNALRNKLSHRLVPHGFAQKREEFIDFALREAHVSDEFRTTMSRPAARLVAAIFVLHSALSAYLRFKPVGLMGLLGARPARDD